MPIEFACRCGKKLRAAEEHAGKRAKCNQCGQISVIPAARDRPNFRVNENGTVPFAATPTSPVVSAPKKVASAAASKAAAPFGLDDLLSSELPLAQPAALAAKPGTPKTTTAAPVQSGGRLCPNCQSSLSSVAVLCVDCGYNLNTGKKTSIATLDEIEAPKKRPPSRLRQFFVSRITSWKLWSGLGMMTLAAVWFLFLSHAESFTLRTGRGFIYILILFVAGGISFINGLFDGDNA